jgi:ubiquinone/menaquinone biosynthesis C-methylase UbiE
MDFKTVQKIIRETRNAYDIISYYFSQTRNYLWKEFKDFKKYFNEKDKVLDFGCGNGRFYELIKDLNPDYYGVDLSPHLLEIAQNRISKGHFLKINEDLNLPFEDIFFDKIVCLATFHHIPSKELEFHLLKEFYRTLKPSGILILTVWDFYHVKNKKYLWKNYLYGIINFVKRNNFLGFKDFYLPWKDVNGKIIAQRYFHAFTKKELNRLITRAGFKILSSQLEPHNKKKDYYNLIIIAQK